MFTAVLYHTQVLPSLQREYSAWLNCGWQQEEMDFRDTKPSILSPKEWMRWKRKCQIPNRPCMYTCDCVHTAL